MAGHRSKKMRGGRQVQDEAPTSVESSSTPPSACVFIAGVLMLSLSIVASIMLVLDHFGATALPGCGEGSACAKLTAGPWGKVPIINWPISFVGLAYFAAVLTAWWASRHAPGGLASPVRWIVRLGAAASLLLIGVMGVSGEVCWYCLAAHVGNLGFFALVESIPHRRHGGTEAQGHKRCEAGSALSHLRLSGAFLGVFAFITAALIAMQFGHGRTMELAAERELEQSTVDILAGDAQQYGFRGRYVYGPEEAAVRIVVFTGYQCVHCQRFEEEVKKIMAERDDVSLSVKHVPLNSDCNPHATRRLHPNGCWAARAAEAAGLIGGPKRFWDMHFWLIERGGSFTEAELRQRLVETGYDVQQFFDVMQSEETRRLVIDDVEEGMSLGLRQTPMVFINGVELRGWGAADALRRTIERVAAAGGPGSALDDRPPDAFQKHIDDWRAEPRRALPAVTPGRVAGPANATVRIDVWGDYLDAPTAQVDAAIRAVAAQRDDVRYTFRHSPGDPACNPRISAVRHAMACRAAYAGEAAAQLDGDLGYWRMHDWLIAHRAQFSDELLRRHAADLGFDADALLALMDSPGVQEAVRADAEALQRLRATGRAVVFINEQWVPRWRIEGHDVLGTIIEEASRMSR